LYPTLARYVRIFFFPPYANHRRIDRTVMQSAVCAPVRPSHRVRDQLHQRRLCKRQYSRPQQHRASMTPLILAIESRPITFDPHQIDQTTSDSSVNTYVNRYLLAPFGLYLRD